MRLFTNFSQTIVRNETFGQPVLLFLIKKGMGDVIIHFRRLILAAIHFEQEMATALSPDLAQNVYYAY